MMNSQLHSQLHGQHELMEHSQLHELMKHNQLQVVLHMPQLRPENVPDHPPEVKSAAIELRSKTVARRMKAHKENEQRIAKPRNPRHLDTIEGGRNNSKSTTDYLKHSRIHCL